MNAPLEMRPERPQYWMPPHVRACVTATGAILLDLRRNRYFGIGMREARALRSLALNWTEAATSACPPPDRMPVAEALKLAGFLSAAGFLASEPPQDPPLFRSRSPEPLPSLGIGSDLHSTPGMRVSHVFRFIHACLWARYAVGRRRLFSIASDVGRYATSCSTQTDLQRAIELVCIFRCLRPYAFSARNQCLFHALALLKFLSLHGVVPTWVIAVRQRPWSAHSWLQLGSLVLDCNPEELNGFTPILTI